MASIQRVDGEHSAARLADLLNGNTRRRPVVVVTVSAGRDAPWIDVEEIAREADDLAEVYLMPTGNVTWEFSRRMAEGTQVYGGAARVYPVGHEWASDMTMAPLRFAFDADDGKRATQQLISDMLRMASAVGLSQSLPTRQLCQVNSGKAELVLYPRTTTPAVTTTVLRRDVTTNPADDLRTLMTVGEVIPVRVVATAPRWSLVLDDVDDDEPIVDAPSLLPDGPPWLVEEGEDAPVEEPAALVLPAPPKPTAQPEPVLEEPPALKPPVAAPPGPTPAFLDRNRPRPTSVPSGQPGSVARTSPTESTRALLLKIDGLAAEVRRLNRHQDGLRTELHAGADEREQLRYLLHQAERRANRAENDLKAARSRLRGAGNAKSSTAANKGSQFADAEQGFRYLVLTGWAIRTLPSEQSNRPLPEYVIGPRFLHSLHRLEGITEEKVADVVFEIVTGLAPRIAGRQVHRLRTGPGGDDPFRLREDGATAWRASLQVNTPSARRLHYWVASSGMIEFVRVAMHDDYDI